MAMGSREAVPSSKTEYVEWALEKAGGAGLFQFQYVVGLGLVWAYNAHLCYIGIFAGMPVEILSTRCKPGETCLPMRLDCGLPRSQWQYAHPLNTYIATFDLVCDRAPLAPLLPTLFFFGCAFGVLAGGRLSDAFGRRRAFGALLGVTQVGVLAQAMAQNYSQYAAAIFLTGAGSSGLGLVAYVWNSEMLGKGLRSVMAWAPNCFFSLGQILLSMLAMQVSEWRRLTVTEFMVGSCFMVLYFAFEESPKWLATQGRVDEAHVVLCSCARVNGRADPAPPRSDADAPEAKDQETVVVAGPMQLLDRRLRTRFAVMCFAWFATSMGYYGLVFNAASLPLDIYSANIVSGLACIPAYLASGFLVEWIHCGRRGAVAGGFLVSGACLLASIHVTKLQLLVLYYIAISAVSLSFAVIYVWGSELFPTDIRGSAMGMQSLCARVGAMAAPAVAALGDAHHPTLPLLVFAAPCLAAGCLAMMLPETRGCTLPGTLADMDSLMQDPAEALAKKGGASKWYGSADSKAS